METTENSLVREHISYNYMFVRVKNFVVAKLIMFPEMASSRKYYLQVSGSIFNLEDIKSQDFFL